jgi:excinuclease ABC subunit B
MYADETTASMQRALDETNRRRLLQEEYNAEHGIVPETIVKSIEDVMAQTAVVAERGGSDVELPEQLPEALGGEPDREGMIARLEKEMLEAAAKLEFELAASLRDRVLELRAENASGIVAMRPRAAVRQRKSAHSRRRSRR